MGFNSGFKGLNYDYILLFLRVGYVLFTSDIAVSKFRGNTTKTECFTQTTADRSRDKSQK